MSNSGEPISKCPVCRYDLTGLPKNHTCPECGFEYDESMRAWLVKSKHRWMWLFVFYFTALTILHFAKSKIFQVMVDVGLIAWFVTMLRIWRRKFWIITGKRGLVYKNLLHGTTFLPWDQIVFPDRAKRPRRLLRKRLVPLFIPVGGLTSFERSELYQQIRAHLARTPYEKPKT